MKKKGKKNLRESSGTKVVTDLELPHASEDLGNASVKDSQTSDDLDRTARGNTGTEVEQ